MNTMLVMEKKKDGWNCSVYPSIAEKVDELAGVSVRGRHSQKGNHVSGALLLWLMATPQQREKVLESLGVADVRSKLSGRNVFEGASELLQPEMVKWAVELLTHPPVAALEVPTLSEIERQAVAAVRKLLDQERQREAKRQPKDPHRGPQGKAG